MNKTSLQDINTLITETYDLFMCCSSFEDRCFTIPLKLDKTFIKKTIIFFNKDQKGKILENSDLLHEKIKNSQKIALHSDNPVLVITELQKCLIENIDGDEKIKILIDITTFTHETLLVLYRLMLILKETISVSICYLNSGEYSYNIENPSEKWLSKGVGDVRSIIGYPGYINPSRKTHLIILFGFEVERTQRIIEKFEAEIVSIGFAAESSSVSAEHFQINKDRHFQLVKDKPNYHTFETSLVDPYKTKSSILEQIAKYPNTNTIIAPMNTKISTIGAALAFDENPDIQLCYVRANIYNTEGYSKPGDSIYFYTLE